MRDDDVGWPYVGGSGVFHDKGWAWVGSTWRDRYVTGPAGWVVVSPANFPLLRGHMGLAFCNGRRREYRQYLVEEAVPAFWRMVEDKFGIKR
ncbi:hypothetical protein ACWGE0_40795 [Lentzea sp. NPDC054927]